MIFKKKSRESSEGKEARPFLEIQYHPQDIRKVVRYFFLTRKQVALASAGVLLYVAFVGLFLWTVPSYYQQLKINRSYEQAMLDRQQQGIRLAELVEEMRQIEEQADDVRLSMSKIHLAYGLQKPEGQGKGGYPQAMRPLPESIFKASLRRGSTLEARLGEQASALHVLLEEVESFERLHDDQVRTTPSMSPVRSPDFVLTSPFGMRISPFTKEKDFHAGIDLAAATGTPIYAPSSGVVTFAGRYPLKSNVGWWRYGNLVAIKHGDRFISLYGHCDEVEVKKGQEVEQGDLIATVGNTGWSTNPHLHYEIRRTDENGENLEPVDPRIYILDHRWRDEEQVLISARQSPNARDFEPLPRIIGR